MTRLGTYGTILDPVTIEVYRMLENPAFNEDYYSNGHIPDKYRSARLVDFYTKTKR